MTNCIPNCQGPTLYRHQVSYPQVCHSISPWIERQVQTLEYLISKKNGFLLGNFKKVWFMGIPIFF
jgi:hypothetical protein